MKCAQCPAWGIDQLGFFGCLVDHSILDLPSGVDGCYMREKTILKKIDDVKANNPRAKYYIWLHETPKGE